MSKNERKTGFLAVSANFWPKPARFELERPHVIWTPSNMGCWAPRMAKLALQGPTTAVFWPSKWGKNLFLGVFGLVIAHLTLDWYENHANPPGTFKYGCTDPWLGWIGHLEAETGHFRVRVRCKILVFESFELISDMDRFNYVWNQSKSTWHLKTWVFWAQAGLYWSYRSFNGVFSCRWEVREGGFWDVRTGFRHGEIQLCLKLV